MSVRWPLQRNVAPPTQGSTSNSIWHWRRMSRTVILIFLAVNVACYGCVGYLKYQRHSFHEVRPALEDPIYGGQLTQAHSSGNTFAQGGNYHQPDDTGRLQAILDPAGQFVQEDGSILGDGGTYKMPSPAIIVFCYNRCASVAASTSATWQTLSSQLGFSCVSPAESFTCCLGRDALRASVDARP